MNSEILKELAAAKRASRKLASVPDETIRMILREVGEEVLAGFEVILAANRSDLSRMAEEDPKYDRLLLNKERLKGIVSDMNQVANLPNPLGQVLDSVVRPNGLKISRISVPIGVVGVVYESRPNVTLDVFAICLKTGNACVLKGSQDARDSNEAIVTILKKVLRRHQLEDAIYLAPSGREHLQDLLEAEGFIDCIIPRGSQGLIDYVRKNATIPVIETGAGIVHVYVDASADREMAKRIIHNSKTRRVSVCNALDCLLIHRDMIPSIPSLLVPLMQQGVELYADEKSLAALSSVYESSLLHHASKADFGKEWLSLRLAVKVVDSLDEALDHIAQYSSKHTECIVSDDEEVIQRFLNEVDAACVYANASTAFSDGGEFGLGAEIGISTQKLHARGPMGLREMTTYKWVIIGQGQIRS